MGVCRVCVQGVRSVRTGVARTYSQAFEARAHAVHALHAAHAAHVRPARGHHVA